jgi:hypothetical protein
MTAAKNRGFGALALIEWPERPAVLDPIQF